jgi:hypothetical protein
MGCIARKTNKQNQEMYISLGGFAKLRKTTVILVMPVCPSVRPSLWNISAPTGWIFMKFDI